MTASASFAAWLRAQTEHANPDVRRMALQAHTRQRELAALLVRHDGWPRYADYAELLLPAGEPVESDLSHGLAVAWRKWRLLSLPMPSVPGPLLSPPRGRARAASPLREMAQRLDAAADLLATEPSEPPEDLDDLPEDLGDLARELEKILHERAVAFDERDRCGCADPGCPCDGRKVGVP